MKQGTGSSRSGPTKVEPKSVGVNPRAVAQIGIKQVNTRPVAAVGRGYKAPMAGSENHKNGSQGKH